MSSRKVYHVVPNQDKGWRVEFEGAQRASSAHDTKAEAIKAARQYATNAQPSQVIIHGMDGVIQTEYTYGDDPYPPAG